MKKLILLTIVMVVAVSASANTFDDVVVYRGSNGGWYLSHNPGSPGYYAGPGAVPTTSSITGYGLPTAVPLVGDINGDGFDDVVVAQAGYGGQAFFAAHSIADGSDPTKGMLSNATTSVSGLLGTTTGSQGVFLADVNGDGIDDAINVEGGGFAWTAHHSTVTGLSNVVGSSIATWGSSGMGDTALMGDFNGDGYADVALYRTTDALGRDWWVNKSTSAGLGGGGTAIVDFGLANDIPLVGDINGDGRDDGVLVRVDGAGNFQWFVGYSDINGNVAGDGFSSTGTGRFGGNAFGDVPFVADINGDGLDDIGVYRNTAGLHQYFVAFTGAGGVLSTTTSEIFSHGLASSDIPLFGDFNIPEPATVILLGLGGLLLRRKCS